MKDGASFIEQLLEEEIHKEEQSTEVYMSMLVSKAAHMQKQIEDIFRARDEELEIIQNFALAKASKVQGQLDGVLSVLESYIRDQNAKDPSIKTIDFAKGTIKLRKPSTKIIVEDMDLFLANANDNLLSKTVKPNLQQIKAVAKLSGRLPKGCKKEEATEDQFSIKIKEL